MKANGEIAKIQADIGVLRYPISATAAEKPLPRKGPESFPSWTSPVRPRSPALYVSLCRVRRFLRPTRARSNRRPTSDTGRQKRSRVRRRRAAREGEGGVSSQPPNGICANHSAEATRKRSGAGRKAGLRLSRPEGKPPSPPTGPPRRPAG